MYCSDVMPPTCTHVLGMLPQKPKCKQGHLASMRGADVGDVKDAIKSFLRTSGNALKLQNLAYALKHGLVLPFDVAPENLHSGLTEQVNGLSVAETAVDVIDCVCAFVALTCHHHHCIAGR